MHSMIALGDVIERYREMRRVSARELERLQLPATSKGLGAFCCLGLLLCCCLGNKLRWGVFTLMMDTFTTTPTLQLTLMSTLRFYGDWD